MPNNIDALIQSVVAKMGREAQAALNGSYITARTQYSQDGMQDLTNAVATGEKSLQSYLKQIAERFQSVGLEVDFDYNRASNTIVLKAYNGDSLRAGEITEKDIPKISISLDKRGVAGRGKSATVNKYAAYESANGEFGIYTLMEKQAADLLNIIDRQIKQKRITQDTSAQDLQSLINWGKRETMKVAASASREAKNDMSRRSRVSPTHQANVSKALEVYIGGYIDSLIAEHGLYAVSQKTDISGLLYTAFDTITGARNLKELEAVVGQLEHDPRFKELVSTPGWRQIKGKLINIRNTGFSTVAGTVNETARQRRTVGTKAARLISPGDTFMSRTVRQQGLTTVRHTRNTYRPTGLATRMGESMGIRYGRKGGWDSSVNTLNVTDDIIAQAWEKFKTTSVGKEYTKKHSIPSVREGGMLISQELARDFETATRDFHRDITEDDYKSYYSSALRKVLRKMKMTEDEFTDVATPADVKRDIEQQVEKEMYARLLGSEGRHVKGSQLTSITQNDNGTYSFMGTEHIGYHSGQRITDTYGNVRSATQIVPREFINAVYEAAGLRGSGVDIASIQGIKEQRKEVNIRNFGGVIGEDLAYVVQNGLARGWTISQIMKILPASLSSYLSTGKGKIYTDNLTHILDGGNTDEEKQKILIDTLIGLDQAKTIVGGVRTYDDEGNLIGASVTANNYSIPDAYDYGHYGRAVSMSSGLPSLKRGAGIAAASGSIQGIDAQQIAKHFEERLGADPDKEKRLQELRKIYEQTIQATRDSVKEGFVVDEKKSVSIGYGDQYDINLADNTIADAEYDINGQITNYNNTIWGRIDQLRRLKASALGGEYTEDDIQAYIDGLDFSQSVTYDDTTYNLSGKKLFIPSYYKNQEGGDYARKDLGAVIGSLKHGETKRANERAIEAIARMQDDLYNKEGTEYRKVYREAAERSMYNKILGSNLSQILSGEDYENASKMDKYKSDLASAGILLSKADAKSILSDMDDEELNELITQLYGVGPSKGNANIYKNYKYKGKKISKILQALTLGTAQNENYVNNTNNPLQGLRALVGRLPFMNGLDIKTMNSLFIEQGLEKGSMRVGAGLARQVNADYDGDRIAVALEQNLSPELKKIFDAMAIDTVEIAKKMALREKQEAEELVGYRGALGDKPIYASAADVYAGIIGKTTKDDVGRLSNYSKSIRNRLANQQLDENALLSNPNGINQQMIAASGMITRALFESIEQDAISSKKVINRIVKAGAGDTKIEDMTSEQQAEVYFGSLTKLDEIITKFSEGAIQFPELINALQSIGVLGEDNDEDSLMSGRVVEQVLETIAKFSHSDQIFANLFGENIDKKAILDKGGISLNALTAALNRVSHNDIDSLLNTARIKKGVNDEGISAESNPAYRAGIKVNEDLAKSVDKTTEAYKQLMQVLYGTGKALKLESELEKGKIVIAGKEGKAIVGNAGSYDLLANSLTNVAKGYDTVTNRANVVTGGMGRQTGGPYGILTGTIKSIRGEDGLRRAEREQWFKITDEERARIFGYDNVAGFLQDRGRILGASRGNLAHATDEALGRAQLNGLQYKSADELLAASRQDDAPTVLKQIAEEYIKSRREYADILAILGYSKEEAQKEIGNAISSRGEGNFNELRRILANNGGTLTDVERSVKIVDPVGTSLKGKMDAGYEVAGEYASGGKYKDFTIVDYKNQDGLLSDNEIAQMLAYRGMLQQAQKEIRELEKTKGKDNGIKEWARTHKVQGVNDGEMEEFASRIKDYRNFGNQVIRTGSDGKQTTFTIGDVGNDIISAILNNVTLTEEQKRAMRGAVTYTNRATGESENGAAGERNYNRSGGPNKGEHTEDLTRYLALLQQRLNLEKQIYQLTLQQKAEAAKGNDIAAQSLKQRIKELTVTKEDFEEEMNEIRHGVIAPDRKLTEDDRLTELFNATELKRIKNAEDRGEIAAIGAQRTYQSKFTLDEQIKNENEINRLLQQRLKLEQQIATEQKTIDTSFSRREQNTLARVIGLQEGQIGDIDAQIQKIMGSGNVRQDQLAKILNQYKIDQGLNEAKVNAKDHGSMTLFNKIKYDIQRSMTHVFDYGISMRILNTIPKSLTKIYQLTTQLESSITSLRIVTGMNRTEAEATMLTYQKLGKQLGATTQEVAESATTWLRQGYAVEEAGNLIDASMKLSKLGFMQADQATQVLTASLKGFKLEVGDALSVVDKLTTMDQRAAVSAQGVSEALSLMANSARLAGKHYARTYSNI